MICLDIVIDCLTAAEMSTAEGKLRFLLKTLGGTGSTLDMDWLRLGTRVEIMFQKLPCRTVMTLDEYHGLVSSLALATSPLPFVLGFHFPYPPQVR
jgi:hypothetical protein